MGFSLGGALVILHGALVGDVDKIIAVSAPSDFDKIENKMWHPNAWIPTLKKFEPKRWVSVRPSAKIGKKIKPVNVKTEVYPGFPTDLGQPMSTLLTQCKGESLFQETIYENRMRHIPHLNEMGANIKIFDNNAVIKGKSKLRGREVVATDLRAGAAMMVAGMIAKGTTVITNIEHILRGYENIVVKLSNVGADIKLIEEE